MSRYHRRRAVTLSATTASHTWHFAFGLLNLNDLFLSSPPPATSPKATTPPSPSPSGLVEIFQRAGMSEEGITAKRKVSRAAAKRVLASDSHSQLMVDDNNNNTYVRPEFPMRANEAWPHRSNNNAAVNPAGTISPNHPPDRTLSPRNSLPSCPCCPTGWCASERRPSNLPNPRQQQQQQPTQQTWSSFHSVSPTSPSKSSNTYFSIAPSRRRPSKEQARQRQRPHGIIHKRGPPNGSRSPRSAAHGGRSRTPTPSSGRGSRRISTCPGLASCNSALSPYYSMSTFASVVGETLMIDK